MCATPFLILLWAVSPGVCQHAHINAGAFQPEQDAQLYFPNGDLFATNSGYVVGLEHTNAGRFAGLYQGSITFTALPATFLTGGPAFGHAALGSYLELEMRSAEGPNGGVFGFWEAGDAEPRFTIAVGTTNGTDRFALSESDGSAESDPYGHIHGRAFTATEPGLYTLGFRIVDSSSNGVGNGPIHTPSEPFYLHFQAGFLAMNESRGSGDFSVTFGTRFGWNYFLESTSELLRSNQWRVVAGPVTGNNHLQTLSDASATNNAAYYRLRRDSP